MREIVTTGLTGKSKTLPNTASKKEIVSALIRAPRTQVCTECDVVMVEDWNLAPIGSNEDNTERIYEEGTYVCDDCYDHWCTKNDIQPLEGE